MYTVNAGLALAAERYCHLTTQSKKRQGWQEVMLESLNNSGCHFTGIRH